MRMMFLIARAHHDGARRWTVGGLASRLGMPAIAVADVAGSLEASGLLTQNGLDEFLPGRDSADIRLAEILDVARNQRAGHIVPRNIEIPEVDAILKASSVSWHASVGTRTLRDLVTGTS